MPLAVLDEFNARIVLLRRTVKRGGQIMAADYETRIQISNNSNVPPVIMTWPALATNAALCTPVPTLSKYASAHPLFCMRVYLLDCIQAVSELV